MKKLLSWLFVLVILISLFTPFALAAGKTGRAKDTAGIRYSNLQLTPKDGATVTEGSITWNCSVDLSIDDAFSDFLSTFSKNRRFKKVWISLYRTKPIGESGTYVYDEYIKTLSSKNYDNKKRVSFCGNGTMNLTSGTYRIKVETTWDKSWSDFVVYQQDFTVVKKQTSNQTQSQPKYAAVTVIHKLVDNGQELRRETKQLEPGTHTLYADYPVGNVAEVYGSSSRIVAVGSNGVADTNTIVFQYKMLKKDNPQNDPTHSPTTPPYQPPVQSGNAYDIGIPNLNGNVYYQDDMNVHVLWVHYQLKATGMYYQGDSWDETGNLGDRTMREIGKFMQDNGYRNHDGHVDQTVINTLADYLGSRRMPVYVGGFYEKMNTIMTGGSAGSMQSIDENSNSTKIKWVQSCLKKLGYYNSSIDGQFGSGTIRALKNFQADCGYVQRDYVSLGVARAMLELCYYRGCNLNDLP